MYFLSISNVFLQYILFYFEKINDLWLDIQLNHSLYGSLNNVLQSNIAKNLLNNLMHMAQNI